MMQVLLGHDQVRSHFLQTLGDGRLHHAWLLHGPEGIGKAMLAGEMAAAYVCEHNRLSRKAGPACGDCHACRMFKANSHPDCVYLGLEQDKRDISVEQVRGMLSFLALSGAESERRVVILDDAEQLNVHAANALLKGFEEPPAGSLLLIVCNDVLRLPATVRSRCLIEHLSPLSDENCRKVLADIGLDERILSLALSLAQGQPGKVIAMQDTEVADALFSWQELTCRLAKSDIGAIQDWIVKYIGRVQHNLIAEVVLQSLQDDLQASHPFFLREELLDAFAALAAWPRQVTSRSLRPGPALLALILRLRLALQALQKAA